MAFMSSAQNQVWQNSDFSQISLYPEQLSQDLLDFFGIVSDFTCEFCDVAERNQWLRSYWRIGCHCACIRIWKHTLTSHYSCCTKQLNTKLRKDQLMLWRPRQDTLCQRIGCYEKKLKLEHWSASFSCTVFYNREMNWRHIFLGNSYANCISS